MSFIHILNTDKLFYACAMLCMNMGSRFVVQDITKLQERILMSEVAKKFILFCMAFVATRDIVLSAIITFAVTCIMKVLLNENSQFCIIPWIMIKPLPTMITQLEYNRAKQVVHAFEQKNNQTVNQEEETKT
jgi:hypothetical protein